MWSRYIGLLVNMGWTIRGGEVDRAWVYLGAQQRTITRYVIKGLHNDQYPTWEPDYNYYYYSLAVQSVQNPGLL
jgi:hypothetical protein